MDDDKLILAIAGISLLAFLAFLAFMQKTSAVATTPTASTQLLVEKDELGRIISINGSPVHR